MGGIINLRPWSETVGWLKEVDRDRHEIILEVPREIRVKLPQEKLGELAGARGKRVSVLRTDGFKIDEFLVDIREETNDG